MAWITGADILGVPNPPAISPAQANTIAEATCDLVETWCGRTFEGATYAEWVDRIGASTLSVSHPPVRQLYFASVDNMNGLSLTSTQADANRAVVSVNDGVMHLSIMGGVAAGDTPLTLSTYGTMALLLVDVIAVPGSWAGAVVNEGDPQNIRPEHYGSALNVTVYPVLPAGEAEADLIDRNAGLLYIDSTWAASDDKGFVRYDGGYAAVPADLTQITLQLALDTISSFEHDPLMQSEKLDKYSWSRRVFSLGSGMIGLRDIYKSRLQPWTRITL